MIFLGKETFKSDYQKTVFSMFNKELKDCSYTEKYEALARVVKNLAASIRTETSNNYKTNHPKKVYYFSMEFLIGPLLENYLQNLGIKDTVESALRDLDIDPTLLYAEEQDPGLGNGGLGRLAACFLDSMAAVGVAGTGIGLRYKFGLFKQKIENGYQVELPDAWLTNSFPWETCMPDDAIEVRFGGYVDRQYKDGEMYYEYKDYQSVKAVPYDVQIIGAEGRDVNILHLYDARQMHESVDMDAFKRGDYSWAMRERSDIEAITTFLYPDDSTDAGRRLRLRQEYFMVAAGMGDIFRSYKRHYGNKAWKDMPKHISIHTNDTHPALCVPEMMRLLIDEEGLEWNDAWKITMGTISFTNHTVLPEALEKWPIDLMRSLLPRIYMIIEEIDRRFRESLEKRNDDSVDTMYNTAILWNGEVKMANMSVIGGHSVNGVAALHSEILKESVFSDFYKLYPERFNNKTNGISHRRFMIQSNPSLAALIDETIGTAWRHDFDQVERLLAFKDDPVFLEKLAASKQANKERFAECMLRTQGIKVNTNSIFDIQVKRIHAYKRQLLNIFKVMAIYNQLKENPDMEMQPYTFVFAGKAAPGYAFAKDVIHLILAVADKVNNDPDVNEKIQVVFVENFCVSNAQFIYPAADISEQISTAGKEASGTGNMKFMMNGAVTLGTLDGANIEIKDCCGDDNICIFGMNADEVMHYYIHGGYNANAAKDADPRLVKITQQLIDGSLGTAFWSIYDALLTHNDEYFVLEDFASYMDAWEKMGEIYKDKAKWGSMSLSNIATSAFFTSDRTIRQYADEIWHCEHR